MEGVLIYAIVLAHLIVNTQVNVYTSTGKCPTVKL